MLSTEPAVRESVRLGFEGKHLFAMQGPFAPDLNLALLRQTRRLILSRKRPGKPAGFEEKVEAAEMAGGGTCRDREARRDRRERGGSRRNDKRVCRGTEQIIMEQNGSQKFFYSLEELINDAFGQDVSIIRMDRVPGGDINNAYRLSLSNGSLFL